MSASSIANPRTFAAIRAADALLYSLGGVSISLRIPSPVPSPGTPSEIGLAAPLFQDVPLAPVVLRALGNTRPALIHARFELLLSASSVAQQSQLNNFASPNDFFNAALGFVYNNNLLRIEQVATDDFAGATYLYRVIAALAG